MPSLQEAVAEVASYVSRVTAQIPQQQDILKQRLRTMKELARQHQDECTAMDEKEREYNGLVSSRPAVSRKEKSRREASKRKAPEAAPKPKRPRAEQPQASQKRKPKPPSQPRSSRHLSSRSSRPPSIPPAPALATADVVCDEDDDTQHTPHAESEGEPERPKSQSRAVRALVDNLIDDDDDDDDDV
eukprot:TRINITY_DN9190_c1_g2_i1.p1 TRINITY_DN9190_c1_g2~~TRINITY_DN9190_c1_g2_i1.p1  ORF type:complete len:187 (+),score=65.92 TRINITY_DN9190_c1_g2_i1:71-631(+)